MSLFVGYSDGAFTVHVRRRASLCRDASTQVLTNLSFDQQGDELTDGSTVVLTVEPCHGSVHDLGRKIRKPVAHPLPDHRQGLSLSFVRHDFSPQEAGGWRQQGEGPCPSHIEVVLLSASAGGR
jgi:hypothetical protein